MIYSLKTQLRRTFRKFIAPATNKDFYSINISMMRKHEIDSLAGYSVHLFHENPFAP